LNVSFDIIAIKVNIINSYNQFTAINVKFVYFNNTIHIKTIIIALISLNSVNNQIDFGILNLLKSIDNANINNIVNRAVHIVINDGCCSVQ